MKIPIKYRKGSMNDGIHSLYFKRISTKSVSAFDSWIISTPVELGKIVVTTTKHFYSGKNTLWISDQ